MTSWKDWFPKTRQRSRARAPVIGIRLQFCAYSDRITGRANRESELL